MDAVILAAGRGTRLRGLAAPFHKPLMLVNGEPLISRAIRQAHDVCERVIIVVAPENVMAITGLMTRFASATTYVVQPRPDGPGSALLTAMPAVSADRVLVLMGDNYHSDVDIETCTTHQYAVGITNVPWEMANRFTVWNPNLQEFQEKISITDTYVEDGMCRVWVGPLVVDRDSTVREMSILHDYKKARRESLIGPHITNLVPTTRREEQKHVLVTSVDVGIPEALK